MQRVGRPAGAVARFRSASRTQLWSAQHRFASTGSRSSGPFSVKSGALFVLTGAGLYYYFQNEKEKLRQRKAAQTSDAKVGRPKIGGPFVLTDTEGREWSSENLQGKWSLVYFGFTNCPDICPEELDRMTTLVGTISKTRDEEILPVFITCDPARDSPKAIKTYLKDFHPSLIGLTGSYEDIKKTCKAYRVYFSTPPDAKPTDDYLVDHSIFFYLMDPNGQFVDAFGRSMGTADVQTKIEKYIDRWRATGGKDAWAS